MRPSESDVAYIKYSAKELLFHQGQQIEAIQRDIQDIKLAMVTRSELLTAKRFAISSLIASGGLFMVMLRAFGIVL